LENFVKFPYLLPALVWVSTTGIGLAADKIPEPLKVFIFAGQSNMAGIRSIAADLQDADLAAAQPSVAYSQGGWHPVAPGSTQNIRPGIEKKNEKRTLQGFGPEISFANRVSKALGEPVGVIKFAVGNSGLQLHWLPGREGNFYEHLVKLVSEAAADRKIEVVGMLWMQGERDTENAQHATLYAKNLATLIETARKDFHNPNLIFIAGRVDMPAFDGEPQSLEAVRSAIANTDLPNYSWVDIDDLPKGDDRLHLNTGAMEIFGNRMADAFLKLYQK
jgi:hypothetical protein